MIPFCAELLPMSENDTDGVHLEQLVDVMQSTKRLGGSMSVKEGNNLAGQHKYTIKLRVAGVCSINSKKQDACSPSREDATTLPKHSDGKGTTQCNAMTLQCFPKKLG